MGLASGLAIALSLSVGFPAQASGGEHGELSDSELTSIALAGDPGVLEGLSAANLKRLIKLSALDTSKTAAALTIQVPPRGAIPNGEQIDAIEQAVGGVDITFAHEPSGAMNASQFATMASGCYLGSYSRYGKNAVGANLYRYWIEIRFCMSGSTVTSTQILSTGGETYWLGWSYDRLVGKWSAIISNQGRN
jgi:hypothetical protein